MCHPALRLQFPVIPSLIAGICPSPFRLGLSTNGGPVKVTVTDSYGVYLDIGITSNAQNLGLIIHNPSTPGGDQKDPGPNEFVNPSAAGDEYRAVSGIAKLYGTHYRPDGKFDNWTVYSFSDTTEPTNNFNEGPTFATGIDSYGAYHDIGLKPNAQDLGFIVHNISTGAKDPGPDMHLNVAAQREAWVISGDATVYPTQPSQSQLLAAGFSRLQAFWRQSLFSHTCRDLEKLRSQFVESRTNGGSMDEVLNILPFQLTFKITTRQTPDKIIVSVQKIKLW